MVRALERGPDFDRHWRKIYGYSLLRLRLSVSFPLLETCIIRGVFEEDPIQDSTRCTLNVGLFMGLLDGS